MSETPTPTQTKKHGAKEHVVKVYLTPAHAKAFKALTQDIGSDMSTTTRQLILKALREARAA